METPQPPPRAACSLLHVKETFLSRLPNISTRFTGPQPKPKPSSQPRPCSSDPQEHHTGPYLTPYLAQTLPNRFATSHPLRLCRRAGESQRLRPRGGFPRRRRGPAGVWEAACSGCRCHRWLLLNKFSGWRLPSSSEPGRQGRARGFAHSKSALRCRNPCRQLR